MSNLVFVTRTYDSNDWTPFYTDPETGSISLYTAYYADHEDRIFFAQPVDPDSIVVGVQSFYLGFHTENDTIPRAFNIGVMGWGLLEAPTVDPINNQAVVLKPWMQLRGKPQSNATPLLTPHAAVLTLSIIVQYTVDPSPQSIGFNSERN